MAEAEEPVSQEEQLFKDWLLHPVTEKLRRELTSKREVLREQWESGSFTGASDSETIQLNARALGQTQELRWLLELDWRDLEEESYERLGPDASTEGNTVG